MQYVRHTEFNDMKQHECRLFWSMLGQIQLVLKKVIILGCCESHNVRKCEMSRVYYNIIYMLLLCLYPSAFLQLCTLSIKHFALRVLASVLLLPLTFPYTLLLSPAHLHKCLSFIHQKVKGRMYILCYLYHLQNGTSPDIFMSHPATSCVMLFLRRVHFLQVDIESLSLGLRFQHSHQ